jgi:hypothetical protein
VGWRTWHEDYAAPGSALGRRETFERAGFSELAFEDLPRRSASSRRAGRPARLSREMVVAAAEEVVRREGVDALTMRRVARELGSSTMALYRHVRDRDELLAELHRVLTPSGGLVIASLSGPLPPASLRNWWLYPPMEPALNVHADGQMEAMLTDAGFTDIRVTSDGGGLALQLAHAVKASS